MKHSKRGGASILAHCKEREIDKPESCKGGLEVLKNV